MIPVSIELKFLKENFASLFPLEEGEERLAGGKRPGQTAGLCRHSIIETKEAREHLIELGYGIVPERSKKEKDGGGYPLLLPKLDPGLAQFNMDGNTSNILVLRFREDGKYLVLDRIRNFGSPREVEIDKDNMNQSFIAAVMEIVPLRIKDICDEKLNTQISPEELVNLIRNAIDMRSGHKTGKAVSV